MLWRVRREHSCKTVGCGHCNLAVNGPGYGVNALIWASGPLGIALDARATDLEDKQGDRNSGGRQAAREAPA